ncbi:MAG: hypothetical protein IJ563_07140 [Selenomonadaceae bacterium]|nr:hypothetical protein [Selenomonadaceae bacterium]
MKKKLIKSAAIVLSTVMLAMSPSAVLAESEDAETPSVTMTSIPKGHIYIPKDTVIEVEVSRTISTKEIQAGDMLPFVTSKNLIINDVMVIPKGSKVKAVATRARRAGAFGRGGRLEFQIVSVKALNGVEIPLEFGQNKKANNDEGAIAASVFYVVGGAFMKGKNVIISEGTRFDAMVAVDTDLEATIENLAEVMSEDKNDSTKITIH